MGKTNITRKIGISLGIIPDYHEYILGLIRIQNEYYGKNENITGETRWMNTIRIYQNNIE